jgi:hypothetical protein
LVYDWLIDFWCFNATFNNISAISWRPVLVVEEAGSAKNFLYDIGVRKTNNTNTKLGARVAQ